MQYREKKLTAVFSPFRFLGPTAYDPHFSCTNSNCLVHIEMRSLIPIKLIMVTDLCMAVSSVSLSELFNSNTKHT
jgi:hypothetical protein